MHQVGEEKTSFRDPGNSTRTVLDFIKVYGSVDVGLREAAHGWPGIGCIPKRYTA